MSKILREFQSSLIKQAYVQAIRSAMEHDSPEALKKYLQDHPDADRAKHTVKPSQGADRTPSHDSDDKGKNKKEPKPKAKTYAQAQSDLQDHLSKSGWKMTKGLKVPYAQKGDVRLWFKPQAIHFTKGNKHSLGDARTLTYDTSKVKSMSPEEFTSWVERTLKD